MRSCRQTSAKAYPIRIRVRIRSLRIRTSGPDEFQNLMWNSLSEDANINDTIFVKIPHQLFQRYESNCGKMSYLAMIKTTSKVPGPEADHSQNLIGSSSFTDTSLLKF